MSKDGLAVKRIVGNEQYFTPNDVARQCVDRLDALYPLSSFDLIVEPSAGDGSFAALLPNSAIALDIDPQSDDIVRADFLTWQAPESHRALVIGNPPFGARAKMAMEFIAAAARFADVLAFILPMSFNKYTFRDRVPREFHLVDSVDIPGRYLVGGDETMVNTVFQIWERRDILRERTVATTNHPDLVMKHAHLSRTTDMEREALRRDFDFAIAQVGANFAPKDVDIVTKGSHWFVRGTVPGVRQVFERLDFSGLERMNTAHTSLSKRDIIEAYVRALEICE